MSAYMIVNVYLRDTQWVKDYIENVPAIIRSYGGEYFAVSKRIKQLEGDGPAPDQIAIFTFPSIEVMDEFFNCEAYKPWKDSRLTQSSADIFAIETA